MRRRDLTVERGERRGKRSSSGVCRKDVREKKRRIIIASGVALEIMKDQKKEKIVVARAKKVPD